MTLPTLVYGCSSAFQIEEQTETSNIYIKHSLKNKYKFNLDILSFNDDPLGRLDSYQRFENCIEQIKIASTSGNKKVYAIANADLNRLEWRQINSVEAAKKLKSSILYDNLDNPIMSGMIKFHAGETIEREMILSPISSIVEIRSLRCDFTGLPYSEEKITDAKAYLLNINAECPYIVEDPVLPSKIINHGSFSEEDLEGCPNSGLFLHNFKHDIDKSRVNENVRLICYPSAAEEESIGSPFTKLVIEGKVEGNTYFWTIPINREHPKNPGIWRNCKYVFDIDIRRKGTTEPDIDIKVENITFKMEIEKWEEKDDYEIIF